MRHATDSDHVVAVSSIVSQQPSRWRAAWVGVSWGIGHTLTLLLVGSAIIGLHVVIPPRLGLTFEFLVALMLIFLGYRNLVAKPHRHDHPHPHPSRKGWLLWRPTLVGIVHGLAGSVAIALLILTTISSQWWAIAYLAVFGLGTIVGMMILSLAMSLPVAWFARNSHAFQRCVVSVTGIASIAFGLFLAYKFGVVDGLFAATPSWTPQ
jgi:high-affinity nickel-transport protein